MKKIINRKHLIVMWWRRVPADWGISHGNRTVWLTLGKLTIDFGRMP